MNSILFLNKWRTILSKMRLWIFKKFFSSPEPKAEASFSDHNLSVVRCRCRRWCCFCHKLFTFSSSSPKPLGQFQRNLAQCILRWRGLKFGPVIFQMEIITNRKNTLSKLKSLLLQNHWANFNQTWHKASLGEGDSSFFFKWRARPFLRGDNYEIAKNTLMKF